MGHSSSPIPLGENYDHCKVRWRDIRDVGLRAAVAVAVSVPLLLAAEAARELGVTVLELALPDTGDVLAKAGLGGRDLHQCSAVQCSAVQRSAVQCLRGSDLQH